ncbi:uncharacterized protein LOC134819294 [Bolinopsis microptera]|uniref:uncharacterized protein LOC134819294 n=1 Tax=Bolinopsis microptera TaxID=2820187 RepID=UPI00307A537F
MTLTKKTVSQIKLELDDLGIVYRSTLRKAELLSLLEASLTPVTEELEKSDPYSPPYTRRRTTMATVDLQSVTSNLLKLDSSPIKLDASPMNHASAVIDELESADRQSEEVSVDVQITKEDVGSDEHVVLQEEQVTEETVTEVEEQVIRNGTSSPEEEDVSDITDSDEELEKEVTDQKETFITKTTFKRRSQRIKKQHEACSGALFSDDELPSPEPLVEVDGLSTTSSQDERAAERKSLALKIFIVFILLAVVSNTLAYLYLSYPSISDTISGLFKSAAQPESSPTEEL